MQIRTTIGRSALVVLMLLGALVLGTPAASAVEAGPVCEQGVLTADNQCEISTDANGGTCPEGAIADGGECYEQRRALLSCSQGVLVLKECQLSVDDGSVTLECEAPYELTEQEECAIESRAVVVLVCAEGEDVAGECTLDFGAPQVLPGGCPELEDAQGCYTTEPQGLTCATGEELIPEGFCQRVFDAEYLGELCHVEIEGAVLYGDDLPEYIADYLIEVEFPDGTHCGETSGGFYECEVDVRATPDGICIDEYFGDTVAPFPGGYGCWRLGEAGYTMERYTLRDGVCWLLIEDLTAPCPNDNYIEVNGGCAVYSILPAAPCRDGYVYNEPPVRSCSYEGVGTFACRENLGYYLLPELGPETCFLDYGLLVTTYGCPSDAFTTDAGCIEWTDPVAGCADGTVPIIDTTDCRQAQDRLPDALSCAQGTLDGETCVGTLGPPDVVTFVCENTNAVLIGGTLCREIGAGPTETASCPAGALGEPGSCYTVSQVVTSCLEGATPDPDDVTLCRLSVDPIVDGCVDGQPPVDGQCVTIVDAVWYCDGRLVTINMTLGDAGTGTSGDDVILGTSGPDVIRARAGNDVVCALDGADDVRGGAGEDVLYGGGGADSLRGGRDADSVFGEEGADLIWGGRGGDLVDGGADDDQVRGGQDDDTVLGSSGTDFLWGGSGADMVDGGADNDEVRGGQGDDTVLGGDGNDVVRGNRGIDLVDGGAGDDTVSGGHDADDVRGGTGDDTLVGGRDVDALDGGAGFDGCNGRQGNDTFVNCETVVDP